MPQEPQTPKRSFSADWLVQGVLTKIGDTFDRLTGRGWKPSSSLATSELIDRLKKLLDAEARETDEGASFVPHNIKLKMQWDKFSTDAESALEKLRNELLTAAVDHINDNRYYTYAPISLEVKPDYFTSGVKLFVSFDSYDKDHEAEVNVTVPELKTADLLPDEQAPQIFDLTVRYAVRGNPVERRLQMKQGMRLSIGRTKENDIALEDQSVSKFHASLAIDPSGGLVVADTGSTNGTFVRGERIAYGKATEVRPGDELKLGEVKVDLELSAKIQPQKTIEPPTAEKTEVYRVGEFEFAGRPAGEENGTAETPAQQPSDKAI